MEKFNINIIALGILIAVGLVLSNCTNSSNNVTDMLEDFEIETSKMTLRYLKEVEWPKAYREQDTILLDRILADEFEMIGGDGSRSTKLEELNWIKNNSMSPDTFYYEIKRLDIFENGTAMVCGTGHIINDSSEMTYESSNTLIYRNGLWKAVSSHVSGYKKQ